MNINNSLDKRRLILSKLITLNKLNLSFL